MNPTPTLHDVARLAGVNEATVSRAFSRRAPVAAKTRERIFEAARRVGYRPSMAARMTRTGRSGLIGVVRSPVGGHSVDHPSFLLGLGGELHRRGLCPVGDVLSVPGDPDMDPAAPAPAVPRIIREHLADGFLINYAFGMPEAAERLLSGSGVPAIWINQLREQNCVRPDDRGAAAEATAYLLGRGCRDIAYVAAPASSSSAGASRAEHFSRAARERGYRDAMSAAGVPARVEALPPLPPAGAYERRLGHVLRSHVALLSRRDRPEAVLCEADGRVMLAAASEAGLRVPGELAVFGIDNDPGGDVRIAMDRLVVPFWAMGRSAVEEVCGLIEEPDRPRPPVVLPFEFHRAGTVA
ncbi:LacI family DNA-binding transcriptional regulator [Phycisphaera mikurensis]|uniref:Putative LacI family transcriptional regulator n=1 Tax=Phycisphaera mikurensis (strain NBRC 102666 / KCTC 22515 / FYK2301M01) TaxID=1142394 RepID=I0ICZ2_PHYMF|nr:LacI family DNA-binding transcriptional regulator [Phycisphaera mikurensis]MBB6442260.1 LacI family transcriptional regulator [Phycisphaera mikurensis]BAM03130.1 putative LacI family transcriptional regulator [Phycisphaera mikurensis NBRC 102666]